MTESEKQVLEYILFCSHFHFQFQFPIWLLPLLLYKLKYNMESSTFDIRGGC